MSARAGSWRPRTGWRGWSSTPWHGLRKDHAEGPRPTLFLLEDDI